MMGWLLLLLCTLRPAHAIVFDRVVAQVQQQLVLASEVALEDELTQHDPGALPFWSRSGPPLDVLVQATVLRVAAGDVGLYQPDEADVAARLEAVRRTFEARADWEGFLNRHGLDEVRLSRVLRRRLVAERFLRRNVQASLDTPDLWVAEARAMITQLESRVRIRYVPELGGQR